MIDTVVGGVALRTMKSPNLHTIRHAQSVLMRDSFVRDSFTEDTLFSVWDQLLLAQFCDTWFAMQRCGGESFPLIAMWL